MEIFCTKDVERILTHFLKDVDEEVVFHQPFPEDQNNWSQQQKGTRDQQEQPLFSKYFELVYEDLFVDDVLDEDGLSGYLANGFVDETYNTSYDFQNRADREMLFMVLGFLFDQPQGSVAKFVQTNQRFLFGEQSQEFQHYMNEEHPSEKPLARFRYFLQENHRMVQDVLQFGFAKQVAQKIVLKNWNSPDVDIEKVREFKKKTLKLISSGDTMLKVCVEMQHIPRTMILYLPSISPFGFLAEGQQIRMSLVNRITIHNTLLYEANH